jgi:hypothetical protein
MRRLIGLVALALAASPALAADNSGTYRGKTEQKERISFFVDAERRVDMAVAVRKPCRGKVKGYVVNVIEATPADRLRLTKKGRLHVEDSFPIDGGGKPGVARARAHFELSARFRDGVVTGFVSETDVLFDKNGREIGRCSADRIPFAAKRR